MLTWLGVVLVPVELPQAKCVFGGWIGLAKGRADSAAPPPRCRLQASSSLQIDVCRTSFFPSFTFLFPMLDVHKNAETVFPNSETLWK